jgi:hypothetical protein
VRSIYLFFHHILLDIKMKSQTLYCQQHWFSLHFLLSIFLFFLFCCFLQTRLLFRFWKCKRFQPCGGFMI